MHIRKRQLEDLPQVTRLLQAAGLQPGGLERTEGWIAVEGNGVLGHVALEFTPDAAVLRSLVVHSPHQGRGIARRLVVEAEAQAGGRSIVLRTDTIGAWMERRGYQETTLDRLPRSIHGTSQFEGEVCAGYRILARPGMNPDCGCAAK